MLKAEGLSYRVRDRQILRRVGLNAEPGEFVGVIGPNGSGKSTLLKSIYKALRPQEGAVLLMGDDLLSMSNRQMAQRLSVVLQEQEQSFDFSVEEVVMMGRLARRGLLEADRAEDRRMVEDVLRRTQLQPLRGRSWATLSGGEKQRVLIARALAQDTPCLILDEPTNHLDVKYQLQLLELVRGLGRTVVAALHDLDLAALYCHRLYVMKDGAVVASGPPGAVLTPQLIRRVYEVEAEVMTDRAGRLRILYHPEDAGTAEGGTP